MNVDMENKILQETSKNMRTQNNRATQYPLFVIQNRVKEWVAPEVGVGYEYKELKEDYDNDDICDSCMAAIESEKAEYPDEDCVYCSEGLYNHYNLKWEFDLTAGVFFTEEAAKKHIKQNYYHYHEDVRTYVVGAWRNPEMQEVMKMLVGLTGEDIPQQYE